MTWRAIQKISAADREDHETETAEEHERCLRRLARLRDLHAPLREAGDRSGRDGAVGRDHRTRAAGLREHGAGLVHELREDAAADETRSLPRRGPGQRDLDADDAGVLVPIGPTGSAPRL